MKFLDAYCITSDIMKNLLQRMDQVAAENPGWDNPEWKRSNPAPYTKTVYEKISEDIFSRFSSIIAESGDRFTLDARGVYSEDNSTVYKDGGETFINTHDLATELIDCAEYYFDINGITVPSIDRTGDEGEARIYGDIYGDLVDATEGILNEGLEKFADSVIYEDERDR